MNKNNAAVIIDGPEAVFNSKEENKPINTDNKPPITERITICFGSVSYTHLTLPTKA